MNRCDKSKMAGRDSSAGARGKYSLYSDDRDDRRIF